MRSPVLKPSCNYEFWMSSVSAPAFAFAPRSRCRCVAVQPSPQNMVGGCRTGQNFISLRMDTFIPVSRGEAPAIPDISSRLFILVLVASFAVAIALHGVLYAGGLYAISADESGRALDALAWVETSDILVDAWLPFYQVATGFALKAFHNLFLTPRIVSFAFGLVAHGALLALTMELFRRRDITAMAAAISAVIHHRVIFGVVPLAEIMYMAVLIAAMAFLARRLRTGSTLSLLLCAVCLAVATTIRYEAWFFGLVLAVLLCIAPLRRWSSVELRMPEIFTVLAILAAFPLWWLWQQYLHTGHPTGFLLHSPDRFAPMAGGSALKALWHNVAVQFIVQNIATAMLIGLLSVSDVWRASKPARFWLAVPLGAIVLLSLVLLGGKGLTTHNPWRLASGWSLLLVPFAAHWLVLFAYRQQGSWLRRWSLPALLVALCLFQTAMHARATSVFSKADLKAGRFLSQQEALEGASADSNKILIETTDWQYLNVVIASGQPDRFVYNSGADPLFPQDTLIRPGRPVDMEQLRKHDVRFLFFREAPYTFTIERDTTIAVVAREGGWTLYDIAPRKK